VVPLGLIELQGVDQPVEDTIGHAADAAAFQPGVVLDTDPREKGHFLAA